MTGPTVQPPMFEVGVGRGLVPYMLECWSRRDFILALTTAQVRSEFADSLLGAFWLLLNPLILSGVYFVVFGLLFDASRSVDNYVSFLIVGLLVFTFSSRTATGATKCLRSNASLLQSIRFPRAVIPISTTGIALITHLPSVGVMLVIVIVTGEPVRLQWLLLPVALLIHVVFNLGIALATARIAFHFSDMEQIIPHVFRLTLYVSGVLYAIDRFASLLPGPLLILAEYNPFWVLMGLFRGVLIESQPVPDWPAAFGWAATSLVVGLIFFRRREIDYAHV